MAKHQDLCFERRSRSEKSDQPAPDQPAEVAHRAEDSADSLLQANRIRFVTGTAHKIAMKGGVSVHAQLSRQSECCAELGGYGRLKGSLRFLTTNPKRTRQRKQARPVYDTRHWRAHLEATPSCASANRFLCSPAILPAYVRVSVQVSVSAISRKGR